MQHVSKNLVTVSEAARILRASEATIRNYEERGTLRADRLSNGTRVFERTIVDALKGTREKK